MDETGDEGRFTAMYDACRQRVWAYAAARAGQQAADEAVSETFAVAWRRIRDVPEPPLPWLLGVARNVLRDSTRANRRWESSATRLPPGWTDPAEEDVAVLVTERMTLLHALATLHEDDRDLLILTAWQGLDQRDAAQVLGCAPTTLRVRLHRARKRLVRTLDNVVNEARDVTSTGETAGSSWPHPTAHRPHVRIAGEEVR
ncbi:RNA polymerase ECF-subfamily sigma factor [Streptomyces bingchenggensis BCW-1]|uniref:RNA polymerase ECF-subfamily sigma factor n=1 Tax=Streptomyces bingchenggensis (strain BCW-1) TaxID=749414 RepID=D7BZ77_STRBB|nr:MULTISPECIES: sigma-70 family RNA polymerase sigma factor [Streptomyces]ADI07813.1 RNA polymerase ECF-subfamily sigma factor [Streptomyces bingchenggensis BCW-1]